MTYPVPKPEPSAGRVFSDSDLQQILGPLGGMFWNGNALQKAVEALSRLQRDYRRPEMPPFPVPYLKGCPFDGSAPRFECELQCRYDRITYSVTVYIRCEQCGCSKSMHSDDELTSTTPADQVRDTVHKWIGRVAAQWNVMAP